jgi:predicted Zn-dependent peptidase
MSFTIVRDPVVGEEVLLATTRSGLRVRVLPRPRLREAAAVFTFGYGSVDLAFDVGNGTVVTPAGTAHYLEHKLFEDEELAVFQRFSSRGARVNAQTGFSRTSYFFQCAQRFDENLRDLLRLVAKPHVTPENVEKERGIIAQEVRMYEDAPDQCAAFSLLGAMYERHPVRHTVGGTVASIGEITAEGLLQAYDAFYRTGNAGLAIAGPVDPDEVLAIVEECALRPGGGPARADVADFGAPATRRVERVLPVARPKVLVGLKEREPRATAFERVRRASATGVVLDRLFAGSSDLRERMQQSGAFDDSLGAGYMGEKTFGFASIGCDTDDPARAEPAIRAMLATDAEFSDEQLERLRRRSVGAFVRSCEHVRALASAHAAEALEGEETFVGMRALQSLTTADVARRRELLLRDDNLAVCVVRKA